MLSSYRANIQVPPLLAFLLVLLLICHPAFSVQNPTKSLPTINMALITHPSQSPVVAWQLFMAELQKEARVATDLQQRTCCELEEQIAAQELTPCKLQELYQDMIQSSLELHKELNKKRDAELAKFVAQVQSVADTYVQHAGLGTRAFDAQEIPLGRATMDITQEVVERLNKATRFRSNL